MCSGQEMHLKVSSLFLWRMLISFSGQLRFNLDSSIKLVISSFKLWIMLQHSSLAKYMYNVQYTVHAVT